METETATEKEKQGIVKKFGWASFLNDFGAEMVYPIWPIFVTSVLGTNMAVLGFLDGLGDAVVSISKAVSGYYSDKIKKRKIFIWPGYFFGSLSRIGYALSATWHWLIPFRILDRLGKLRDSPRDAVIADVSTESNRGKNFGHLRMMDNLGATFGVVAAIILVNFLSFKTIFILASIPSVIAVILVLFFTKDYISSAKAFKGIAFKDFNKDFRFFVCLSSVFALASFSYSFLIVFSKSVGVSVFLTTVFYALFNFTASLASVPFGKLCDKIGRKPVLLLSFIFWAIVCLLLIFFQNWSAILLAFIFYGLSVGAFEPSQRTLVSELVRPEIRASALGGFQMIIGFAALPSSLIAGALWDFYGPSAPFVFSLVLTAVSIVMILFFRESKSKKAN